LSNLLVVPISFAILVLGLVVLGTGFITVVATIAGILLEWTIRLVNYIVFSIESLPFQLIENIYLTPFQCCLLMALIVAVIGLAEYRKFGYLIACSLIVCLFATAQWWHFSNEVNIQKFVIYKVPGHSVIDFIDRGQAIALTDSLPGSDARKIDYHICPNRLRSGVRSVGHALPGCRKVKGGRLIAWQGMTILHITDDHFAPSPGLSVDWVIVGNNAVANVAELSRKIAFQKLILDSSNSPFYAKRFLEGAKLHKFEIHSVLHQGAFAVKIENPGS
jgi:competence protein ComEC